MKENLQVSFSGGETSAYMAQWIKKHWQDKYNIMFIFANTGNENKETLDFVEKCDKHFGLGVNWVEAVVSEEKGVGTKHKVVNYKTASRKEQPFKDVISKYGIPNQAFPHCTRELKLQPMTSFSREYFNGEPYYSAIGIRSDEADRINENYKKHRLLYPLVTDIPMTKPKINFWWSQQPFRLNLKGYQGNCKTCWKKGDAKLYQIYHENPEYFEFNLEMEREYGHLNARNGERFTFFRRNRSAEDIIREAKEWKGNVRDDSQNINYQTSLLDYESESCEVFSSCGDK